MPRERTRSAWQRVGSIVATIMVVAALYLGQTILVPFALATLLAFLLAPVVHGLERLHLPRVPAVVVTVLFVSLGVAGLGWVVYGQLDSLADSLPEYRENILRKIDSLRGAGPIERIEKGLADVAPPDVPKAASAPGGAPPKPSPPAEEERLRSALTGPVPVTVVPAGRTPLIQFLGELVGPLLAPLGMIGVVFVLVLFMLVYQEDLRNRLIRLVSRSQLVRTTQALSDVSERISKYLLMTLVVNATYGIPVGLGLWILGVPNALLWGLFAVLLRFVPYVGPWIAAGFPILLSFAISPGWTLTALVVGLFVVLELISNNLVEPRLYGKKTGLSPMAVIVAAIFWTWLWGTTGLLLSIPLTLVLAVVGQYVPHLKFLSILLRDEPGLWPSDRFYQRLVAGDAEEAAAVAEEYLKDHSVESFYDEVVIPALRSTRHDALDGRLDAESLSFVRESTRTLVDEMADRHETARATATGAALGKAGDAAATPEPRTGMTARFEGVRVAFVSAGDETDDLAGLMLADVLRADGLEIQSLAGTPRVDELVEAVRSGRPDIVCVGGIPPYVVLRARHLCRRLRSEARGVRVVLGLWDARVGSGSTEDRMKLAGADHLVASISAAAQAVRTLAAEVAGSPVGEVNRPAS